MIKNYLTIALRNLTRQPGYTVINVLVHQALNPDPHKLVLFLLLGVGKILPDDECRDINALCLGITPVFLPACRSLGAGWDQKKITLSMGFIT